MLAVLVLGATACRSDDAPSASPPSTVRELPATTAGPSTTSETTTTTSATSPCASAAAVPSDASTLTEEVADVDGDGRADAIRTFLAEDTWVLQVEVAAGGGAELALGPGDQGGVGLVGGADVDGDGRAEIWVRVGSGASTVILGLVRFQDCGLARVTLGSGQPVELPVGGSVGATAGVECRADEEDADLTTFAAFHRDGLRYEVTATQWALEGAVLVERTSSTRELQADDPDFVRATTFTCHDLAL